MTPSEACEQLVKDFEGLRLSAYLDASGVPTIGWGHTLHVRIGDVIGQDQADVFLASDLEAAAAEVTRCLTIQPNQDQFDALTDFEFNTGALAKSTLLAKLDAGDVQGAADQFLLWAWAHVNGKLVQVPGLVRRRAAERALFLGVVTV
jgi:lysozyme